MRLIQRVSMILLASGALALGACGGGDDDSGGGGGDQGDVNPDGTHHTYVLDDLTVPASQAEASAVSVDVDGNGTKENALGNLLATLATFDLDIQTQVDGAIAKGTVIILADVQATDLSAATGVGLEVFLGENASPAPCADADDMTCGLHLEGGASFDVKTDYDALVVGPIVGGAFTGGPGDVTIELALSETDSIPVHLVSARVEMNVAAGGLTSGKLGGAISSEDVDNELIPGVADLINGIIADCVPEGELCCPDGSAGEQVLTLFNSDGNGGDCEVTTAELLESDLVDGTIRNPDLDLFNGDSDEIDPNQDGVKDAISLGVGFSAVGAVFTP